MAGTRCSCSSLALADTLRSARYPQVQVLGPISGFMERKAGKFRMQLLVQGPSRAPLAQLLDWAVKELETLAGRPRRCAGAWI